MPDSDDKLHECPALPSRDTQPIAGPRLEPDAPLESSDTKRYRIKSKLGRGGMGEVLLAHDEHLDRTVALKRASSSRDGTVNAIAGARLLQEARVQASLDHPAFAPVFDAGTLADGASFFTMARLEGDTLAEVLKTARTKSSPSLVRARLLRAFAQMCHAVSRAHEAGVVHGDLKPANLMLGHHGQVFVLDLGIASKLGVDARGRDSTDESEVHGSDGSLLGSGTPGYGAPEQFLAGSPDARWDVYALGAILFEILTLEGMHRRAEWSEDVHAWYSRSDPSPRRRYPQLDIAPELDSICTKALHLDPAGRTPDAQSLADAVERYLDGQRDHEERHAIAARHVERALEWHARSLDPANASSSMALWRRAISSLGLALALVPADPSAADAMSRIMGEVPPDVERDVDRRLETWTQEHLRVALVAAGAAYAVWTIGPVLMLAMGVRNVVTFASIVACGLATVAWCAFASRRPRIAARHLLVAAILSAATLFMGSRWFGPSIVTTSALVANAVAFGLFPTRFARLGTLAVTVAGMFAISAYDRWGGAPMLHVDGELILIRSALTRFPPELTWWSMTLLPMGAAILGSLVVSTAAKSLVETTRREYRAHWHLATMEPAGDDDVRAPAAWQPTDASASDLPTTLRHRRSERGGAGPAGYRGASD